MLTDLPPLPPHRFCLNSSPVMVGYTAEEMTAYAREAQAATLATVTPLVQAARAQALQEAHDAMFDIKGDKITRFDAQTAIRKLGQTAGGATKESTDHG